ncbi:MAG: hypothetical protein QFB87_05550 [Patescibacteria group bacterium]|nr:hypothetical protein [Patescibacteria group bacterium]
MENSDEQFTQIEGTPLDQLSEAPDYTTPEPSGSPLPHFGSSKRKLFMEIGVVATLLLFGIILAFVVKQKPATTAAPAKAVTPVVINTQSLDNGTLNKISAQANPGGEVKQQLTITPDTLFKGTVEVQKGVKVDQALDVGGTLNVKGASTLQGAVGVGGNLSVRGGLSVAGPLSAASINVGSLTIANITLSGSLNFAGHLVPSGAEPTSQVSPGAAGGKVAISGNDTAGTITITTGAGPFVAGEIAQINFRSAYATTPKVQLTPLNNSAANLNYFATHTPTFFTINATNVTAPNTTYIFDYLVTQ